MRRVVVVATGGTIASSSRNGGPAVASRTVEELVAGLDVPGVAVEGRDLLRRGSYLFTHADLRTICDAVTEELQRDDVDGVVVTHGTDTMEETAYLLDLVHDAPQPVVLTGAQKAADRPDSDGPYNLAAAVRVAASPDARGCGALVCFGDHIFAPARLRKHHTLDLEPFRASDSGPVGRVVAGAARFTARPVRPAALPRPGPEFDRTRVDVVALYPGADAVLADAAVSAGAQGVVLAGTGAGNGNHAIRDWVRRAAAAGTVIGLSTRVAEGPVAEIYGNGGAADLVASGALSLGGLPLFHGRLLLALLLSSGDPVTKEVLEPYV
ncbi:MAG TPA: asparaginase [Segeticoccus sp.]|uniref:asparaginase n=1 Tax=Segeticoccus sp. TaxID=2706531 RepID=UPI002D804255|nr:asparaginase [Segeticoccus sp.]HET8599032.1 asparaginase [Segeticoccus sp.]